MAQKKKSGMHRKYNRTFFSSIQTEFRSTTCTYKKYDRTLYPSTWTDLRSTIYTLMKYDKITFSSSWTELRSTSLVVLACFECSHLVRHKYNHYFIENSRRSIFLLGDLSQDVSQHLAHIPFVKVVMNSLLLGGYTSLLYTTGLGINGQIVISTTPDTFNSPDTSRQKTFGNRCKFCLWQIQMFVLSNSDTLTLYLLL